MDQTEILRFANSEMGRGIKIGVGGVLALAGLARMFGPGKGGFLRAVAGAGVAACGALDMCAANLAFGLPMEGPEARAQLG